MLRLTPIVLLTTLALSATAQSSTDLLTKATTQSTLADIQQPWHAKLAITLFDAEGKNTVEGNIEYWQSGDDFLRTVTFGDVSQTLLRHDKKRYMKEAPSPLLDNAEDLINSFLHPGPQPADLAIKPVQRQKNFGKATFPCFMLGLDTLASEQTPLGLYPTYCVEPDTAHTASRL